jgi:nucleotide-binding universal stress UspA family protein
MITCIVAGTDESPTAQAAVREAVHLARQLGARLHLVGACRQLPAWVMADPAPVAMAVEVLAENTVRLRESLQHSAARLAADGVAATAHVAEGEPGEVIVSVAEEVGADLIVVGNRGMRGARRVLGSVPNWVSHHAPCSVLIVRTC